VREEGDDVAKATYTLALAIVMTAVFMCPDRVDASNQQETTNPAAAVDPTSARVRTEDPVLATLIRDATARSATFRRLIEAIAATDGIVYIERGRCGQYARTCLAFWMTVAGPNRILRVIVDDDKNGLEAVESIAHELQHALEVLSHRNVTTAAAMHGLFERIGVWRNHSFETYAAIKAGGDVRSELRRQRLLQVK
jgi:hypothetical protein